MQVCRYCLKRDKIISTLAANRPAVEEFRTPEVTTTQLAIPTQPSISSQQSDPPPSPGWEQDSPDIVSSQGSTHSDWAAQSEFSRMLKKEHMDNLIKTQGIDVKDPYLLEACYDTVTPRRRFQVKNYLAAGIFSIISTIASTIEEHSKLWMEIKESNAVDKFLKGKPKASKLLSEVIHAYNSCGSRKMRTQILSLIVNHYSYSYLNQFNPPTYRESLRQGMEEEQNENDEELMNPLAVVNKGLYFNPPLTAYKYHKSRIHFHEHEVSY